MSLVLCMYVLIIFLCFSLNSRLSNSILSVIAFMLFVYMSWNVTDRPDYDTYKEIYLTSSDGSLHKNMPVWLFLCTAAKLIGVNFRLFQTIVVGCGVLLILFAGYNIAHRISILTGSLLIYPGVLAIVQIRQFLSLSLMMVALSLILGNRQNKALSILLTVLAAGIHPTSLFFITIFFSEWMEKHIKLTATLSILVAAYLVTNQSIVSQTMDVILGEEQTNAYYAITYGATALSKTLLAIFVGIVTVLINALLLLHNKKLNSDGQVHIIRQSLVLSLIYLLFLPVTFWMMDVVRFQRLSILATSSSLDTQKHTRELVPIISKGFHLICLLLSLYYSAPFESAILPFIS